MNMDNIDKATLNTGLVKSVMIIDEELPIGLITNTAAVMGVTLGQQMPEFVGQNVPDKDGNNHLGIIEFPVPILKAKSEFIKNLRQKLYSDDAFSDLLIVDFSQVAQSCKTYDEYIDKMSRTQSDHLEYLGLAICGDKKKVNKLTGSLPLLR